MTFWTFVLGGVALWIPHYIFDREALTARRDVDQRPVVLDARRVMRGDFAFELADREVQADDIALAIDERGQRFVRIAVLEIDRNLPLGEELAQRLDREAVRRVHAQHRLAHRECALDLRFDFGREAFEQRRKSRRDALVGPGEALAERGQLRAAAALARDERVPKCALAVAEQAPRITVGKAGHAAGRRQRAGLLDADEERGQARNERRSVLPAQLPMGVDRDFEHVCWNAS